VIESPFHAVRLRTTAAKRYQRTERATAIIWKLLLVAERTFRRLNAPHLLPAVASSVHDQENPRITKSTRRLAA
jgi:hypothetical protein